MTPPDAGPPAGGYGAVNPYEAPGARGPSAGALLDPPGSAMKWLFLAGHAAYWVFSVGGILVGAVLTSREGPESGAATLAPMIPLLGVVFLVAALVAAMVWLHAAWGSVPEAMRTTDGGRWITPGQAVGYCFIPFYNLYWMFVANVGLCDAVNRALAARGAPPRAPRGLAVAACVSQLVPYCGLLVAPILWAVYMFQMDAARREMLSGLG